MSQVAPLVPAAAELLMAYTMFTDDNRENSQADIADILGEAVDTLQDDGTHRGMLAVAELLDIAVDALAHASGRSRRECAERIANIALARHAPDARRYGLPGAAR